VSIVRPRRLLAMAMAGAAAFAAFAALGQEAQPFATLGLKTGNELPGVGRVLLSLAVVVTVAVMAAYALRRFWPSSVAQGPSGALRATAQLAVSRSLKLHLVELGEITVLVAESRDGVAIAQLDKGSSGRPGFGSDAD
jgi:flagellar biogenesis protein FliO